MTPHTASAARGVFLCRLVLTGNERLKTSPKAQELILGACTTDRMNRPRHAVLILFDGNRDRGQSQDVDHRGVRGELALILIVVLGFQSRRRGSRKPG